MFRLFPLDTFNPMVAYLQGTGVRRAAALAGALGAASLGLWWAAQHPLGPGWVAAAFLAIAALAAARPAGSVVVFAALLPVVDLSLQTGPWVAGEADLLVLATVAGALAGRAVRAPAAGQPWLTRRLAVFWVCSALVLLGGAAPVWWAPHPAEPGLWWPASKAFVWASLLLPLWLAAHKGDASRLAWRWICGHALGLALVGGAVLLELVEFSGWPLALPGYRAVGWFWEMRLGGGAIDVYMAATLPLATWALLRARPGGRWWALAGLLLVALQVLVATQSRALVVAALAAIALLLVCSWRWPNPVGAAPQRWRWVLFAGLLVAQMGWGLYLGSDLQQRLATSAGDLGSRLQHWGRALDTLAGRPIGWGLGAGQLPSHYGAVPGEGEFPGRLEWRDDGQGGVRPWLSGPLTDPRIGHLFGLSQRLHGLQPGTYTVRWAIAAAQPATLLLSVCERHLLYDRRCQWRRVQVPASDAGVPPALVEAALRGSDFARDGWLAPARPALLGVSVLTPGATVRVDRLELWDATGRQRLANTDFRAGAARWVGAAQGRFEPWHVDNLYLEFLVERGALGLLGLLVLLGGAVLAGGRASRADPWSAAPGVLAAVLSLGLLGLLISSAEMPRLMLLVWLALGMCLQLKPKTSHKLRM
jgi:hypothetical protein